MELLMRRWAQAKAGDGCVVLIAGEPGIGKSRIAEAVRERLGAEPHTRLRFFCSPYHQDSALYPAIAQLERFPEFANWALVYRGWSSAVVAEMRATV
jgi:predicted ATPase